MVDSNSPAVRSEHIEIRRGKLDSVTVYEVTEEELKILEQGGSIVAHLNWAIFLFSIAFAAFVALVSSIEFKWAIMPVVFTSAILVGIVVGTSFLISWKRSKKPVTEVVQKVRDRLNGGTSSEENSEDTENKPKGN